MSFEDQSKRKSDQRFDRPRDTHHFDPTEGSHRWAVSPRLFDADAFVEPDGHV